MKTPNHNEHENQLVNDQQKSHRPKPKHLTNEAIRKIAKFKHCSDAEVEAIRTTLYEFASVLVEAYKAEQAKLEQEGHSLSNPKNRSKLRHDPDLDDYKLDDAITDNHPSKAA